MTKPIKDETEVLKRRVIIFETKIAEEKEAIRTGKAGPGNPTEITSILGETRRERLGRWESTAKDLKRTIDQEARSSARAQQKVGPVLVAKP
jgi:hypothetical protein